MELIIFVIILGVGGVIMNYASEQFTEWKNKTPSDWREMVYIFWFIITMIILMIVLKSLNYF